MNFRVIYLLLFFTIIIWGGCKKKSNSIVHEPDKVVKQDSFQHIQDSIKHIVDSLKYIRHLDSLEATFVGTYLVSGTCRYPIVNNSTVHDTIVNVPSDTLFVQFHSGSSLTIYKARPDSTKIVINYGPCNLSGSINGMTGYNYDQTYSGHANIYWCVSFLANDSISAIVEYQYSGLGGGNISHYELSGSKIH